MGDTEAARAVTAGNAADLTTDAADDCPGAPQQHAEVGGGNRAAFLEAFENAVDAATHSVLTGVAPAGATLKLERTGVFPLWDGSKVADTVVTTMTTRSTGTFRYHANPSTRPFVQSRKATALGEPKDTLSTSGNVAPLGSTDTPFEVTEAADVLAATLTQAVPTGADTVRNMDLVLLDPSGEEVARTDEFAQVSSLTWAGPDGDGVPPGRYVLRVENTLGLVPAFTLEARTADVRAVTTERQFEQWTLTCITAAGVAGQRGVSVERGETVDVGDVCGAGLAARPTARSARSRR